MKNQQRAAAQTASIGNQDMMTFIPGPPMAEANEQSQQQSHAAMAPAPLPPLPMACTGVPDSLDDRDTGESMDEEAFNASLDALLKEANSDAYGSSPRNLMDGGGLDVGADMGVDLIDPSAQSSLGIDRESHFHSEDPAESAASPTKTPEPSQVAAALHPGASSGQVARAQPPQQNSVEPPLPHSYSAQSIVQLPQMFASQPISVAAGTVGAMPLLGTPFHGSTPYSQSPKAASGATGTTSQAPGVGLGQHQQLQFQTSHLAMPQHQLALQGHGGALSPAGLITPMASHPQQPTADAHIYQVPPSAFGQLHPTPWAALASLGFPSQHISSQPAHTFHPGAALDLARKGSSGAVNAMTTILPAAQPSVSPAPVSSGVATSAATAGNQGGKRKRTSLTVSEDEDEKKKRRSERNLREQERSHRITERIAELRNVLAEAGVHFKPDKYSTLVSVVSYIKQLQKRSRLLDEEHKKLLDTIASADRLVKNCEETHLGPHGRDNNGTTTVQTHSNVVGRNRQNRGDNSIASSDSNDDEFHVFVQGIDYKFIFSRCGVALAVASVDGRFVDCNEEFLRITNYSRNELLGEPSGISPRGAVASSGGVVTVSSSTSCTSSALSPAAAAADSNIASNTPDMPSSAQAAGYYPGHQRHPSVAVNQGGSDLPPNSGNHHGAARGTNRPPPEIHMPKQHLSLFNLLGREDMETVYTAMSRMLRSNSNGKEDTVGTSSTSTMKQSSSSDSLTRSTEESSSGNEVSPNGKKVNKFTLDHWSGKVKHTRRKDQMLQLNISLIRTPDGRPKFFNCSLSEIDG